MLTCTKPPVPNRGGTRLRSVERGRRTGVVVSQEVGRQRDHVARPLVPPNQGKQVGDGPVRPSVEFVVDQISQEIRDRLIASGGRDTYLSLPRLRHPRRQDRVLRFILIRGCLTHIVERDSVMHLYLCVGIERGSTHLCFTEALITGPSQLPLRMPPNQGRDNPRVTTTIPSNWDTALEHAREERGSPGSRPSKSELMRQALRGWLCREYDELPVEAREILGDELAGDPDFSDPVMQDGRIIAGGESEA